MKKKLVLFVRHANYFFFLISFYYYVLWTPGKCSKSLWTKVKPPRSLLTPESEVRGFSFAASEREGIALFSSAPALSSHSKSKTRILIQN